MCPVDDYGIRADIIMNSSAVFNRMNTAQWIEQDVNRTDYFVLETIKKMPYKEAFNYLIEYLSFINPKWGELTAKLHNTDILKQELINEVLETGMIHKQVSPFQEGTDQHFTLELQKRYPHPKTPVTFSVYDAKGNKRTVRTRKPVCIGDEYIYILYKTPHQSSAGVAYVNQFHAPIRPSKYGKMQYPFSQTPIRLGEDEGRNITMVAGSKVMARLLGMYANSPTAVEALETRLIHDPSPSTIQQVDVTTKEAVNTNTIIGVTRHIFSCLGIDIAPQYRVQDGTTTQIALPEVEDRE